MEKKILHNSFKKLVQNEFAVRHAFDKEADFLTEIKPSELESDISRIEWRRKFETIHSRHWFKNCSN